MLTPTMPSPSTITTAMVIARSDAADASEIDRKLPADLPRRTQVYRPETSTDHHDVNGQPCGCTACGGRLSHGLSDSWSTLQGVTPANTYELQPSTY